jgi:type IV pilus assembly protein PilF
MSKRFVLSLLGGLAFTCLVQLAGCATQASPPAGSTNSGGGRTDTITESDEPEVRRRARIRLELASGYFEQGQTTVALDEIKQSLQTDPTYAEAFSLRGLIYMRLGDMRQAEDSFRRAVALNSRDPNTLHNYGWLMCQQGRYPEANTAFTQALTSPNYADQSKTLMTQGLCQARAGQRAEAERTLARSYELDAGNPITGYNLASLLYQRGDFSKAQFYLRRLNNSEFANAETLWLGIRVERRLNSREAMEQLADQLKKRFAQSKELAAYNRGAFDE